MTIVTRMAPSPTGAIHLGTARTALFNFLFARHNQGEFLFRVEDTDTERSRDEHIASFMETLHWLGMDWDEGPEVGGAHGPYFQSQRNELYRAKLQELADRGRAYEKDGAWWLRLEGARATVYDDHLKKEIEKVAAAPMVLDDLVRGRVERAEDRDFVIFRSNGEPVFHFVNVVDDIAMGITHVIRGEDHLSNTSKHLELFKAFGAPVPSYAHIPLILKQNGPGKMSKRDQGALIEEYQRRGYLPEALRNYLVRLGWSHGDKEFFTTQEMIDAFDLPQIGRSPARFDFAKLENLNGHYIRSMSDAELLKRLVDTLPYLPQAQELTPLLDDALKARFLAAMPGLKERAKTLGDLIEGGRFIFARRPLALDAKAAEIIAGGGRAHLAALVPKLEALGEWTAHAAEAAVRVYVDESGAKLGQVAQPLRAALTGRSTSPGIFDVLQVLGRRESLARLRDQAG